MDRQKISNMSNNDYGDSDIEEDIQYEGKFDNIDDNIEEDDQDEFVESISK